MKKRMAKPIFQQLFIALFVFSLICPGTMWAKRVKQGAKIIVTKNDSEVINGRLLRVDEDSLLLLVFSRTEGFARVTIGMNEIDKIRIKRKSKILEGLLFGAIVGGALAWAVYPRGWNKYDDTESLGDAFGKYFFGPVGVGLAVGCLYLGADVGHKCSKGYKTIEVKKKSPSEMEQILKKLKKRARFKD